MEQNDFLIETRLRLLDPELHHRFTESVFFLPRILSNYEALFPEFTDHSETHSLAVIDHCNRILGTYSIDHLNADELYVLLMSSYLHDAGMGISKKDYREFCEQIDFKDFFDKNDPGDMQTTVRAFHNDFSGCFIRKYASLFDFPSEEHMHAVVQVARGHRKADLFDEKEYPEKLPLKNGNTISLPFLAAVLRLADEVNVEKGRNSKLLFDPNNYSTERQRLENAKHEAIQKMNILHDRIELIVKEDDPAVFSLAANLAIKLQKTLDYCVLVASERSDFRITQKKVKLLHVR